MWNKQNLTSELNEQTWAVISERGCVARNLVYEEAVRVVRKLSGEAARGLCIITNEAASRLPPPEQCPDDSSSELIETQVQT